MTQVDPLLSVPDLPWTVVLIVVTSADLEDWDVYVVSLMAPTWQDAGNNAQSSLYGQLDMNEDDGADIMIATVFPGVCTPVGMDALVEGADQSPLLNPSDLPRA